MTPVQLRQSHGTGKSPLYIKGNLKNGVKNRIAMQIEPQQKGAISSTPFLQELIGILAEFYISIHTNNCVMAYTDCKAALAKIKDALTPGSNSTLHLPYGPLIGVIGNDNKRKYQIDWIPSHPEKKKKKEEVWNMHDHGIYRQS